MKFSGLVTAVLAAAVLAGCQSEPEPTFADPTDAPTSETTAAASPTDKPKGKRAEERAFLGTFWSAVEDGAIAGDPSGFLRLAEEGCESCKTFARNIRDAYRRGGSVQGIDWTVTESKHIGRRAGRSVWHVDVKSSKETWLNGEGEVVNTVPAGTNYYEVELRGRGDDLKVADFSFLEP